MFTFTPFNQLLFRTALLIKHEPLCCWEGGQRYFLVLTSISSSFKTHGIFDLLFLLSEFTRFDWYSSFVSLGRSGFCWALEILPLWPVFRLVANPLNNTTKLLKAAKDFIVLNWEVKNAWWISVNNRPFPWPWSQMKRDSNKHHIELFFTKCLWHWRCR